MCVCVCVCVYGMLRAGHLGASSSKNGCNEVDYSKTTHETHAIKEPVG